MITANEAHKLYETNKVLVNQEALENIEKLILEACKRGEPFCEVQKISDPIMATLHKHGYNVVTSTIVLEINGIRKSISGYRIFW